MGKRWRRETHAPELTTDAQWQALAPSANKYMPISLYCSSCSFVDRTHVSLIDSRHARLGSKVC